MIRGVVFEFIQQFHRGIWCLTHNTGTYSVPVKFCKQANQINITICIFKIYYRMIEFTMQILTISEIV